MISASWQHEEQFRNNEILGLQAVNRGIAEWIWKEFRAVLFFFYIQVFLFSEVETKKVLGEKKSVTM